MRKAPLAIILVAVVALVSVSGAYYTSNITIPSVNDHITVTGPYVLDTDHYNWAEIHPVYSLTIS